MGETPFSISIILFNAQLGRASVEKEIPNTFPSEPPGELRGRGSQHAEIQKAGCVLGNPLKRGVGLGAGAGRKQCFGLRQHLPSADKKALSVGTDSPSALSEMLQTCVSPPGGKWVDLSKEQPSALAYAQLTLHIKHSV